MNWREAFKEQAKSDYKVFVLLNNLVKEEKLPVCHSLHYLQMASEKIAKSFQCRCSGEKRPPMKHSVIKTFVKSLKATPEIQNYLGYKNKRKAFNSLLENVASIADEIENLAPSGQDANSPNSEYPWQVSDNPLSVITPANYSFKEVTTKYIKFKKFIEKMLIYEQ